MRLKNIHLPEDFLAFVKSEAQRRNMKEAEIIREIVALGKTAYMLTLELREKEEHRVCVVVGPTLLERQPGIP